jgi:hypothetical protein
VSNPSEEHRWSTHYRMKRELGTHLLSVSLPALVILVFLEAYINLSGQIHCVFLSQNTFLGVMSVTMVEWGLLSVPSPAKATEHRQTLSGLCRQAKGLWQPRSICSQWPHDVGKKSWKPAWLS